MQTTSHPFAENGDLLLQMHARKCAQKRSWRVVAEQGLWRLDAFFGHRFATSVMAGALIVVIATSLS